MAISQVRVEEMAAGRGPNDWKKDPVEPWQGYLAALFIVPIIAFAAFWAINGILAFAREQYAAPGTAAYIVVPVLTLILAFIAYYVRETAKLIVYPMIEIGVGLAAAAQSVPEKSSDLVRFVALLAGVRITVDGITRFKKFMDERAPPPAKS